MKKEIFIDLISYSLFFLFTYTGISKIFTFKNFLFDLGQDPLIGRYSDLLAIIIPLTEIAVAFLLLLPKYRKMGLIFSAILMTIFTFYVGYILAFKNEERHCTCGGVIREMSWRSHLWFNLGFTLIAFTGILLHSRYIRNNAIQTVNTSNHS